MTPPFDMPLATADELRETLAEVRAKIANLGWTPVIDPARGRDRLLELKEWEDTLVRQIVERELR